ncbi:MAG: DUF1934 domain-containing protein [Clostridiales bacterium]|nr:DUF1934 domain-containing protein [Clostridiales bacterium]
MTEIDLQIETNVYNEPYRCKGKKHTDGSIVTYEWEESREKGEKPSKYRLTVDPQAKSCELIRAGDVKSKLTFKPGERTLGSFVTVYGEMEMHIKTMYINMPNMFTRSVEISYSLDENSDLSVNTFVLREI